MEVNITTYSGKGGPLSNAEIDANFENLKAGIDTAINEAYQPLVHDLITVFDYATGRRKRWTVQGASTLRIDNSSDGDVGDLFIIQDASGGHVVTLPGAKALKSDGTAKEVDTTASRTTYATWVNRSGTIFWDLVPFGVVAVSGEGGGNNENGTESTVAYNGTGVTLGESWSNHPSLPFAYSSNSEDSQGVFPISVAFTKGIKVLYDDENNNLAIGAVYDAEYIEGGVTTPLPEVTVTAQGQLLFEVHPNTGTAKTFRMWQKVKNGSTMCVFGGATVWL